MAMRKLALRDRLHTERSRRPLLEVSEAARAIAEHLLTAVEVRHAATVAAYVSTATEPGTGPLLDALVAAGKRIVLPVLLPDGDLDWAAYDGPTALLPAGRGLLEPAGERLGPDAVATADVVLTPGLAVDRTGMRLGRGGGSYDRALGRVPIGTFTCTLLYDEELIDAVPAAAHDRRVCATVTPGGITRYGPPGSSAPV
ncbi:MAG: 5-formyltetrahydrofolate cyclo-ligase [Nocardioidaceae bacterium]